jgi:hypothetical protein
MTGTLAAAPGVRTKVIKLHLECGPYSAAGLHSNCNFVALSRACIIRMCCAACMHACMPSCPLYHPPSVLLGKLSFVLAYKSCTSSFLHNCMPGGCSTASHVSHNCLCCIPQGLPSVCSSHTRVLQAQQGSLTQCSGLPAAGQPAVRALHCRGWGLH